MTPDPRQVRDDLVQQLTQVTWALELGDHEHAVEAARAALATAQGLADELLPERPDDVAPGDLRRSGPV